MIEPSQEAGEGEALKLWLGRLPAAVGGKMEASCWGCKQCFLYTACVLAARAATELSDSWSHPQRVTFRRANVAIRDLNF